MTVHSDMGGLLFRNNLAPNDQFWKEPGSPEAADTLPGNGDALSGAGVKENSCRPGLEMLSNYFQTVWASQHPRSISHLPLVSQVIVAKEKVKPNISNFSGLTRVQM